MFLLQAKIICFHSGSDKKNNVDRHGTVKKQLPITYGYYLYFIFSPLPVIFLFFFFYKQGGRIRFVNSMQCSDINIVK